MKISKENREKFKEIIDLTLDIEELGAHVFLDYSGSVKSLTLHVYKNGWSSYIKADYQNDCYVDNGRGFYFGENIDECIKSLKEMREQLRSKEEKRNENV